VSELKIVKYPHPALRFQSKPLQAIDKEVRLVAGRMLELMQGANGLGLAGNQVAWPFQMFVMNPGANEQMANQPSVLINPVILERKGTVEGEEGCLSFPELYQKVRRAKTVKVQAYDLDGKLIEVVASELPSRVLQHEIDHLAGVLFIDKMGPLGRLSARGSLREFEREFRKAQEKGEYPSDAEIEKRLKEQAEGNGTPPIL
jgi:peptide deformylase